MAESSGLRGAGRQAGDRKGREAAAHRDGRGMHRAGVIGGQEVIGGRQAALRPRVETAVKSRAGVLRRGLAKKKSRWMIFRRSYRR